jgi:Asp-tRNA(Asn)/Glu-tRNA(Gln) amidotransferase C subunit
MEGILDYIKQIEEVDLPAQAGVPDIDVKHENYNSWREDVVLSEGNKEIITEQFPDSQNGFVKVKKII